MEQSILQSVKKLCGIVPEYTAFDDQIMIYINTTFSYLHQFGIGPEEGFEVTSETTWDNVITEPRLNMIKNYVSMKVQLMFNPPQSSFALKAIQEECDKLEWRITSEVACYGQ